jgi:glycerol-3-phosphate acyltransferase PlsX
MRIVIDGLGGDNAPDAIVAGAAAAVREYSGQHDFELLITGDVEKLQTAFNKAKLPQKKIELVYANGAIKVEDNPLDIRSSKSGTSMGVAFDLVKSGKADAIVSGGSTAALVVGGSSGTTIGRIKGVKRCALAPIMPSFEGNYILLDGGANIECRPEMLLQFGIMGSIYASKAMGITKPRVGLLNIGTEAEKGRELELGAYKLLKSADLNFIGNIEAREVPLGGCDVVITDGFTGNIYLKAVEGMGVYMKRSLKEVIFGKNTATKAGYLLASGGVKDVRRKTDYREVGGAPLLGTAKPIIKAHGSSDALAFKNAIRQAIVFVKADVISDIEKAVR